MVGIIKKVRCLLSDIVRIDGINGVISVKYVCLLIKVYIMMVKNNIIEKILSVILYFVSWLMLVKLIVVNIIVWVIVE